MERIVETGLAIAIRDSLVIGGGVNGRRGSVEGIRAR